MSRKTYVFDHFLFTSRRGEHPAPWYWEIRRKSRPGEGSISAGGFRSSKAAEEAGKIVLAQVRNANLKDPPIVRLTMTPERAAKSARRAEIAATKVNKKPLTAERRSENARIAARARAEALSPERRSEIGRMGGAASKGRPKVKRHNRSQFDS